MSPHSIQPASSGPDSKPGDEAVSTLATVIASLDSTTKSIDGLIESDDLNQIGEGSPGISLLALKADTLASYLHHLVLRSYFALSDSRGDGEDDAEDGEDDAGGEDEDGGAPQELDKAIRQLLVTDRVVLERGIRPLEKKIEYQVQKLLRAAAAGPPKKTRPQSSDLSDESDSASAESGQGEDAEEEDDDDDDDDADDLLLSYKPRPNLLVSSAPKESHKPSATKKYVPPKINPTKLPSTKTIAGPLEKEKEKARRVHKNRALEEYLEQTTSNLPESSLSVGSNVLGHGRGGTRTKDAQAKEDRVRGYEEENFVRLPEVGKKKRKKPRDDEFMGENWDLTGADIYGAVKRKKKSVWDRNR